MSDTVDTLEIEIVAAADPAVKELKSLRNQMSQLGKAMKGALPSSNGFSESLKKIGETFKGVGSQLTNAGKLFAPLSTALAGIGTISVKTAADFEVQMSKVQAISGASSSDMEKLSALAKEWGANSKFSATESAQAFEFMGMAGWKTDQMLAGIPGILNLAVASGEDLGKTSDIVTDALSAFGLTASDSAHFADILAAASTNANTNVSMLGESFKYCAPVAGALGFSAEDTASALGIMANSGIKASSAGTALRSLMNALAGDVKLSGAAFGEMAIATQNSDGSMRSLGDILTDLRGGFDKMTEAEKASAAQSLVGKNAMSGFLAIMNAAPEDIDKLNMAIYNCDGVAADMAATMQDNLNGSITTLKSKLEGIQIVIGDIIMPVVKEFVDGLISLADQFLALDPAIQTTITAIGAVGAALSPALLLGGKVTTMIGESMVALSGLTAGTGTLGTAFTTLTGPVGLGLAAIAAFSAGMATTAATNDSVKTNLTELAAGFKSTLAPALQNFAGTVLADLNAGWQRLQEIMQPLKEFISGVFVSAWNDILIPALSAVMQAVTGLVGVFQNIWTSVLAPLADFIAAILEPAFAVLTDALQVLWDNVLVPVADFLTSTFSAAWQAVESILNGVVIPILGEVVTELQALWDNVLKPVAEWLTTTFSPVFTAVAESIGTSISGAKEIFVAAFGIIKTVADNFLTGWGIIKDTVTTVVNAIASTVSTVFSAIKDTISALLNTIKEVFSTAWNAIQNIVSTTFETIKNVISVAFLAIKEIINAAFQIITIPFRFIWENCSETILSIWKTIKGTVSTAIDNISTTINSVMNTIKSVFSITWNAIKTTVTTIVNAIKTVITTIFNAISPFITQVLNGWKNIIITTWNAIKTAVFTVVNGIKTTITTVFNTVKSTVSSIWNGIKTVTSTAWNAIKTAISTPINAVKNTVSSVIGNIKSTISSGFNTVKTTVSTIFSNIKTTISNKINSAKDTVKGAIDKIKSFFNFSWSLPKLKLPHPKISGSFSLNPPSVPKFSIDWYAKGGILDGAQIFGASGNTLFGGGEAGPEAVLPLKELWKQMKSIMGGLLQDSLPTDSLEVALQNIADSITNAATSLNGVQIVVPERIETYEERAMREASILSRTSRLDEENQIDLQQIYTDMEQSTNTMLAAIMSKLNKANTSEQAPIVDLTIKCDAETLYRTIQKGKQGSNQRYNVYVTI